MESRQLKNKTHYDKHAGHGLEPLRVGDNVFIYTEGSWKPGQVLEHCSPPRSYIVQASDGRMLRRNRRHLRTTHYSASCDDRNGNHIDSPTSANSEIVRDCNSPCANSEIVRDRNSSANSEIVRDRRDDQSVGSRNTVAAIM